MTEAISARLFAQWEGWSRRRGADVHESQVTHHGLLTVESSLARVLASTFPRFTRPTAAGLDGRRVCALPPGGGAVKHVTSHISESLSFFFTHEMPIRPATLCAFAPLRLRLRLSLLSFSSDFNSLEVTCENLQH